MSCTKCLSSIYVNLHTHNIDNALLEDFLIRSIESQQAHTADIEAGLSTLEKIRFKSSLANAQLLLSLLQRAKTFR
jgi:hypothetical protein